METGPSKKFYVASLILIGILGVAVLGLIIKMLLF